MIISNNQIQSLIAQYLNQDGKSPLTQKDGIKKTTEEVRQRAVSQDALALSAAKEAIRELPDIREDRLAVIQQKVKSGTYVVNDEEVAEKMIGRSLVDKLV